MYTKVNGKENKITLADLEKQMVSMFRSSRKENFTLKSGSDGKYTAIYILMAIGAVCFIGAGIMYYKQKSNEQKK